MAFRATAGTEFPAGVQAVKADGSPGALTTVAPVFVQSKQRSMVVTPNSATAKLDGANVTLAAQPVIKNGLLMVPASALTNTGAKVTVSGSTVTIARRIGNVTYTVVMSLDSPDYTWNGSTYTFDVQPYKAGAEVMVPLRLDRITTLNVHWEVPSLFWPLKGVARSSPNYFRYWANGQERATRPAQRPS